MLSKSEIKAAIEKAPAVADAVKKLASKVARGVRLPKTYSVKNLDYDAQRELEHLLGIIGQRTPDGRFYISILPIFRDQTVWREALEYFGLVKKECDCDAEDIFARLKLLEPDLTPLIDALAADEEVVRFVSKAENRNDWKRLFLSCVKRLSGPERGLITTLSQLGSDWFGNSKKLRSGALRRQLVVILAILSDLDREEERLVLDGALIVDNPYTSSVTFSLPVTLIMKDGAVFVNISRGKLVDSAALLTALREKLRGAVLDVFEEEPLGQESPLWNMDNVVLTPHNSFVGDGNGLRLEKVILENLEKFS
jgi:hypothetical protein